jgi:hypothetical protein
VRKVHAVLFGFLGSDLSRLSKIAYGGEANLYTGFVCTNQGELFVKTVSSKASDNEDRIISALLDGEIPACGASFEFQVPRSSVRLPGIRAYFYPALASITPLRMNVQASRNAATMIIRALAELNIVLGGHRQEDCPPVLPRKRLELPALALNRVTSVFPSLTKSEATEIYEQTERIREKWDRILSYAANSTWGLAHGDLAAQNATSLGGKLLLLDLGAVGFAPMGYDLFWLLFKNRHNRQAQGFIIDEYRSALAKNGIAISRDHVRLNAFLQYYRKWLIPRKKGSRVNLIHLREALGGAQRLLGEVESVKWRD